MAVMEEGQITEGTIDRGQRPVPTKGQGLALGLARRQSQASGEVRVTLTDRLLVLAPPAPGGFGVVRHPERASSVLEPLPPARAML
jgi:hypothetical protein